MSLRSRLMPLQRACQRSRKKLMRKVLSCAIRERNWNHSGVGRKRRYGSSTRLFASYMTGRYNLGKICTHAWSHGRGGVEDPQRRETCFPSALSLSHSFTPGHTPGATCAAHCHANDLQRQRPTTLPLP